MMKTKPKMKILVTGGAGFIGSNFIRYILQKYPDYKIVNLDKLTYCGNLQNLKDVQDNPGYNFIKGDICDSAIVKSAMKDCDTIINFAASTHVDRSIVDASDFIHTNVYGTYVLLEAAKKYKTSLFCQIGTDEVYGSIIKGSFKETDSLNPSSPYSASKAAADLLIYSYYVTYKFPVIIVRPTNNFGPYQYPEKVIPLFITNALDDTKLPLYADGMNVRDWLYVLDNCEAIDMVLHKGVMGEIYNISGDNEITNIELTRRILRTLGKSEDLIQFVEDRPGHDKRYSLNCDKIKKLGWKPRHNFDEALKETINWYKENRHWWEPLKETANEARLA